MIRDIRSSGKRLKWMNHGKIDCIMNNRLAYSIMSVLLICSCQVVEVDEAVYINNLEVKGFTGTIEDNATEGTRTSLDNKGNVLWKKSDQVSIFVGSTINEHFQVSDESDGKTSASFNKVSYPGFSAGNEIDNNVAFYPYASTVSIAKSGSAYIKVIKYNKWKCEPTVKAEIANPM